MDWITKKIAIGNYIDASDVVAIEKAEFRSVFCLDGQLPKRRLRFKQSCNAFAAQLTAILANGKSN